MDFNVIEFFKKIGLNIMRMYLFINDILVGEIDVKFLKIFKFVRKIICKVRWKKIGVFLVYGIDCNYIFIFFYCFKFFFYFVCIDLLLMWLFLKKYMYIFINFLLENK